MVGQIQVIQGSGKKRHKRTPNFPLAGVMKPYGLYPIMMHPVLPGETMNHFSLKWRCLSMPIVHPLVGSWLETWLVYVKFTDLSRDLGEMFIDDTFSTSGYLNSGGDERYFTADGEIDWIKLATERFHDAYFIDEGETARTIDGVRKTKASFMSWYENMMFKPADDALSTTDVRETQEELSAEAMLLMMNMTEMSYEKYLEQYGVQSIRTAEGKPEILRYARSWTQPVNTVEPTDGSPSSAWVWSDQIDADKAKRFTEPGFILAVASVRPKFFQKHLEHSAIGRMWGFTDWYPAYNLTDPAASIRQMDSTDAVFHADHRTDAGTKDLLYDHRDLLSHGEQFVNEWGQTPYTLPLSAGLTAQDAATPQDLRGQYVDDTAIDALFVSATASDKFCYYEGIGRLDISGHIVDQIK